jgi:hypothetical protein
MPANMPITRQRTVRGDAVRRVPGSSSGIGLPRFSWPGVVDSLDESPPWVMETAATWTECVVGLLVEAAITFDIKVNGSVIETVTLTTGSPQTFSITVATVKDDEITLEMTDFDDGTAEDVSVCLRYTELGPL